MTRTVDSIDGGYTDDPRRRIELPGVLNLRDVGGYPVDGGGSVRWRTLFRSDALHRLDAVGVAAIAGLGLRSVLDLRTWEEVQAAPSPVLGRVRHLPLLADLTALPEPAEPVSGGDELELSTIYRYFVDECGDNIAMAIAELADGDALPALVHCSAGKDRTGVVVALVLAVLGVPDELIAADYALSAVYLDPDRTPVLGQLQESTGFDDELTRLLLASPPELIRYVLTRVRELAGSVPGYLHAHGVSEAALTRLRSALIV
ncbi:MAG: tyrosine-protein phosphatase [Actinobacteria bacterium]|nr:tyrosine-protein phosphatase [Actinomycetota bacterium]MBO0834502.1 tyrosine-protein phosphatase [Actinomycetota bacterium]